MTSERASKHFSMPVEEEQRSMTKDEIAAYNAGVLAVLRLAEAAAEALGPEVARRPHHVAFAATACWHRLLKDVAC